MAVKIIVPKLGMSAKPLALIEWKVREGEQIEKGATVLVVGYSQTGRKTSTNIPGSPQASRRTHGRHIKNSGHWPSR